MSSLKAKCHLKPDRLLIMGSNFPYVKLSGVHRWRGLWLSSFLHCFLPYEGFPGALLLFIASFLACAICVDVKTGLVSTYKSSSNIAYLLALLNKSLTVFSGLLEKDSKIKVPGPMLHLKACSKASILHVSAWSIVWLNLCMNWCKDSLSVFFRF